MSNKELLMQLNGILLMLENGENDDAAETLEELIEDLLGEEVED